MSCLFFKKNVFGFAVGCLVCLLFQIAFFLIYGGSMVVLAKNTLCGGLSGAPTMLWHLVMHV